MSTLLTELKIKNHVEVARESLSLYGIEDADLHSLLSVILGKSVPPSTIGQLASLEVLQLSRLSENELMNYEGITKNKCVLLKSVFGVAKKLQRYGNEERYTIRSPEDGAKYLMEELRFKEQEHFIALFLNTKNQVIRKKTIFVGSLNASIVHPREIFKEALACSAASIVVAHNHPSTDPTPSREDIEVTKRLVECGKIVGIETLDHIIIGGTRFVSLKEKGYV